MRIRKGDMVVVLTGDDASATPRKVLLVVQSGDKVVVEGVNRVFKHVRRGHPKSQQGGRLSREIASFIFQRRLLLQCLWQANSNWNAFAGRRPKRAFLQEV